MERICEQREGAKDNLEKQAEKMLLKNGNVPNFCLNFNLSYQPVSPDRSVRILMPSVDRAKVDHRNVLAVVLSEEDGLYQLGTSDGVLPQRFVRSQLNQPHQIFLCRASPIYISSIIQ